MNIPLTKAALAYLQLHDAVTTARANKDDAAWDLAEQEETARRVMADAIIRADPQLKIEVRKVCKFSANESGSGAME